MPPAIIAGGIAAAGTIGGAVLSSHAQKSAANQANDAQQAATQAQLQLGRESMALNRDIYNSNYDTLSPFVSRGNVAGDAINALLGLPTAPAMASPLGGTSGSPQVNSGVQTNPGFRSAAVNSLNPGIQAPAPTQFGGGMMDRLRGEGIVGVGQGRSDLALPTIGPRIPGNSIPGGAGGVIGLPNGTTATPHTPTPASTGTPTPTPTVTPTSANDALHNFANSAGMQFQLEQGANALNNLYAAHGLLQSGAAMKAMQGFGQQTALNNYFLPYMGLLGGQQSVGAGAASSIAGVGSSFGNTAAAINAGMGANIQNGANSASNAALARGAANANMYAGIGAGLGGLASSFMPMGGGAAPGGGIVSNYHYTGSFGGY